MTQLLVRWFVKDYKEVKKPQVRQRYGMMSGLVGIICNLILCSFKFFAGIITGAISISADAFNNLSDAGSSIVTLLGFKMAGKPADSDHPFGHGRIEYLAGLAVAAAVIVMGFELFRSSIVKIIHPETMEFSLLSVIILVGSILLKFWMCMFNRSLGKRIESPAMLATATDSISDCVATSVVLISLLVSTLTGVNIDGYAGAIVAIFVFVAGISAAKDTLYPLLGQPPQDSMVKQLESIVLEDEHIIGIHDLIIHDYGPGRTFASLHVEVPSSMDMLEAHDIIDIAEQRVKERLGCGISIHMDPIVTDDETVTRLRNMVASILEEIDPEINMHDFRTTNGPLLTNLIFDVVVPYHYRLSDAELIQTIADKVTAKSAKCNVVITVDKDFTK